MTLIETTDQLPSLPHVLVHILEVMHGDEINFSQLAEHIRHDTAISARLLTIANSTQNAATSRSLTIERALLVLGTDTVKTVIMTMAIRQFFSGFARNEQSFLKSFWCRSLMMANSAQRLASLTGYHAPDQAYLTGLMADVGQLLLLQQQKLSYVQQWQASHDDDALLLAERKRFDRTHPELGAAMIAGWRVDPNMIDAIYRHHDIPRSLTHHHLLTKIINLASRLSAPATGNPIVDVLFGFSTDFLDSLRHQAGIDAAKLAQALEIDTDNNRQEDGERAHQRLGQQVAQIGELTQMRNLLAKAGDHDELHRGIGQLIHIMLDVERSLLFLSQPEQQALQVQVPDTMRFTGNPRLGLQPGHSIVSDSFLENRIIDSSERAALTATDQSLLESCLSQRLLCIPLSYNRQLLGVLVLGIDKPLPMPTATLTTFCHEIAAALSRPITASSDALERRIEEAIHETGNPLSIIGNYLEMLRLQLGGEHQAIKDIQLIQQEIDRIGTILLQLKEPADHDIDHQSCDINALIEQLAQIFERSIFSTRNLTLNLRLDPRVPVTTTAPSSIKQILINLIKNAAEALEESGIVTISTETRTSQEDGQAHIVITIEDNGPGIAEDILDTVFSPNVSTKGQGHTGLGLSITKRLTTELGGTITCSSGPWGSRFQVMIPQH